MSETIQAFHARAAEAMRRHDAPMLREIDRGKSALRLEAAKLRAERERGKDVIRVLTAFRETFRGKGASGAHYAAIIALHRAVRALGYDPDNPNTYAHVLPL